MILITGAGGTIGTALLKELADKKVDVRLAYHSAEKVAKAKAQGKDAVELDFARPETLKPALTGVDTLFLLGSGGEGQTERELNVVRAAKAAGVKRIVKLSVIGAAAEDYTLGTMHSIVEKEIQASGFTWTFLRPNGFMQNFVNLMPTIKTQSAFYQPAADAKISHVDVRDIARVAAKALTESGHEGKAYDLTGPIAFTYAEAADILSRIVGRKISYVAVPDEAAKAGMLAAGLPEWYADGLVDLNRHYRTGAASILSSAIKDVTGREPGTFEQFVHDNASSF
ncbi:MAG: SDR family oxidoreductase [Vicinamibacteria bacterium]